VSSVFLEFNQTCPTIYLWIYCEISTKAPNMTSLNLTRSNLVNRTRNYVSAADLSGILISRREKTYRGDCCTRELIRANSCIVFSFILLFFSLLLLSPLFTLNETYISPLAFLNRSLITAHLCYTCELRAEIVRTTNTSSRSQTFIWADQSARFQVWSKCRSSPRLSLGKFHGAHDHSSRLSVTRPHSPTQSDRDRDQGSPAVSANHVFRSIIRTPTAMHCNRATFLSHDQGGALLPTKSCIVIWYSLINTLVFDLAILVNPVNFVLLSVCEMFWLD